MIGKKLKAIRNEKKLSIDAVSKATGITDSRLSRIERGIILNPSLNDINILLKVYGVSLISFLCDLDYCSKMDNVFENTDLLSEFEIKHIQAEIDFILEEKRRKNDI